MNAATEVIDGITYEVITLGGDTSNNENFGRLENAAKADNNTYTKNFRIVMTGNWTPTTMPIIRSANSVIWDLNGYTYTISKSKNTPPAFNCYSAEITDSSAAGTGKFVFADVQPYIIAHDESDRCKTVTISGGSCADGYFSFTSSTKIIFKNGNYATTFADGLSRKNDSLLNWAPYMSTETNSFGNIAAIRPYDDYAVSSSPYLSGIYNYEFNLQQELSFAAILNYKNIDNKNCYLYGRRKNGEYENLHCTYVDGAWQRVS